MLLDVVQKGGTVQISYWDKNGNPCIKTCTLPRKELFNWVSRKPDGVVKEEDISTNWNGKPCYKSSILDSKGNIRKKLSKNRLYEIVDNLPEDFKTEIFSPNLPKMVFCDIETEVTDGFPDVSVAKEKITCIGMCIKNSVVVLGTKVLSADEKVSIQKKIDEHCKNSNIKSNYTFKYAFFITEKEMLQYFILNVSKMGLLTGWNFSNFDWPYICKRCANLGVNINDASPVRTLEYQNRPTHIGLIDYLDAYKKWTWNTNENYKLDTIGEKICGIKKVGHSESLQDMYENNYEKYIFYNAIDCILVKLIHETCAAMTVGLTTSWLTGTQAMKCMASTSLIENIIRSEFDKIGRKLATNSDQDGEKDASEEDKYEGAFVKAPVAGLHFCNICNDFASLYPSIMRQFNISPESYVGKIDENDEVRRKKFMKKGYIVTANGTIYKREESVLNRILTRLYSQRKSYKKESFVYKQAYNDCDFLIHHGNDRERINFLKKHDMFSDGVDILKQMENAYTELHNKHIEFDNYQLGTKILINAIYGAFGFTKFYFYNRELAESVTTQGKDAILYAEKNINDYAMNEWFNDKETHRKMGINVTKPITGEISVYIDTDSVYSSLQSLIDSSDWESNDVWRMTIIDKVTENKKFLYVSSSLYKTELDAKKYFNYSDIDFDKNDVVIDKIKPEGREFALTFDRVFLKEFFERKFEAYAERYKTPNILNFELESYSDAGIWLAKKKYVQNIRWEDPDVYHDNLTKIKSKGIELAQTSSSKWVKDTLTDVVKYIFSNKNFSYDNLRKKMGEIKSRFNTQNLDIISMNKGMNKYQNYILNDTDEIVVEQKAMVTVRGAALWNHILYKYPEYKNKYSKLLDSDKLCVIYVKPNNMFKYKKKGCMYDEFNVGENCDVISYPAGEFPVQMFSRFFEVDYVKMFELLILQPINRILVAMGYNELDATLSFSNGSLF